MLSTESLMRKAVDDFTSCLRFICGSEQEIIIHAEKKHLLVAIDRLRASLILITKFSLASPSPGSGSIRLYSKVHTPRRRSYCTA